MAREKKIKMNYGAFSKEKDVVEETNIFGEKVENATTIEPDVVAIPSDIKVGIVNCKALNVRANPSLSSDIIKVLKFGESVEVDLSFKNDAFYSVKTNDGKKGYCMQNYIKVKK